MVGGVEMPRDSARPSRPPGTHAIEVRMLGPLTIRRDGVALDLPASRKVRGLFAYLAVAPHAVPRSQLCELLWDVPNDPRGELRWCLSKIRALIDEPDLRRVDTQADTVRLDLAGCFVDALEIARIAPDIATIPEDRLTRSRGAARRRLSRRSRDRPQPCLHQLAHGAAAAVPRRTHGAAGAPRRKRS